MNLLALAGVALALEQEAPPTWTGPLPVRPCPRADIELPRQMDEALAAVLVLHTPEGSGSGVVVSPDGYVLTAAHVVPAGAQTVAVVSREGLRADAQVIRIDRVQDLAVLHVPGADHPCLRLSAETPPLGSDLYAIGSPLGEGLEFSVSKGILSGVRAFGAHRFLQTDASLNGGNSGGPLLDGRGRIAAIVSWKVAASGLEGLGFGVPGAIVAERLELSWADTSASDPLTYAGHRERVEHSSARIVAAAVPPPPPSPPRPDRVPQVVQTVGVVAGAAGLAAVLGTWGMYLTDPDVDEDGWAALQYANAAGWVGLGAGLGLTVAGTF